MNWLISKIYVTEIVPIEDVLKTSFCSLDIRTEVKGFHLNFAKKIKFILKAYVHCSLFFHQMIPL